jgi:indole-3-glycerol phosphate synthase
MAARGREGWCVSGFLAQASAEARARVAEAGRLVPLAVLRERAAAMPAPPRFADALVQARASAGVALIAEVKRASPSKGHLAWIPDPAALASAYVRGGAAAISVLTEPAHFHGTLADLAAVSSTVSAPAIRKDFLVDPYQVWEARLAGAAAVLLIVAALDDASLVALLRDADAAGLDALVEVHDTAEATRAAAAHAAAATGRRLVAGVNARDLATLQVDPARFGAVVGALPGDALTVAESGVSGPADVARVAALGADAVLVGEHLVTADDPAAAARRLVEAAAPPPPHRTPADHSSRTRS